MSLRIVPIKFQEANAFVELHHRHHKPVVAAKFWNAVADEHDVVRGVAITGRPVSRMLDDGWTLEVTRCCTDGARNAPSMLYRAAWKVCLGLGYLRLITYTLPEESGASLRAADFRLVGKAGGGKWSRRDRPRHDTHPLQAKLRWELAAA